MATIKKIAIDGTQYEIKDEAARNAASDLEENKLGIADYSAAAAVGTADNLIDRKATGTNRSFTFDTACGTASIEDDGTAEIKSIHGRTLCLNQAVPHGNFDSASGWSYSSENGTFSVSDGWGVFTRTQSSGTPNIRRSFDLNYGHVYYVTFTAKSSEACDFKIVPTSDTIVGTGISGSITSEQANIPVRISGFLTPTDTTRVAGVRIAMSTLAVGQTMYITNVMFIDVTLMFGSGQEPQTVNDFVNMFPNAYYENNPGQLISFCAEGIRTVGFNQWDEVWESGAISSTTGLNTVNATCIRSKNYIRAFPNTAYRIEGRSESDAYQFGARFYDDQKAFIGSAEYKPSNLTNNFITPQRTAYIRFVVLDCTSYNNNVCLHLVWGGYRNGEYEPYWSQTRALDLTAFGGQMRGFGTVFDEKDFVRRKNIKRVGIVDLGTKTWYVDSTSGSHPFFYAILNDAPEQSTGISAMCAGYTALAAMVLADFGNKNEDRIIAMRSNGHHIMIRNDAYSTPESFKSAMSGVYAYYPLIDPVETDITETEANTYRVADFGTEEIAPPTGEMSTPFAGAVAYSTDFTRQIATMNKNYQSQDSMESLLAALGTACGGTFTATWDNTNSRWTYTFTPNGGD